MVNGRVTVGMAMSVNATMDHRVIDGFHASRIADVLREWMENPDAHFEVLGESAALTGGGLTSPASGPAVPASLPRAP